jgi:YD repeat-containing protein
MPRRFEAYRVRDGVTPLAEDFFNPVLADIDARIAALEDRRADLQHVIDDLTAFGLQRIDTLVGPAMQQLNDALADALAQRDALVAAVGNVANLATQAQLTAAVQGEATARAAALAAEASARDAVIAQATARPAAATYTYDSEGRVSSISETLASGTRTTTLTYDSQGRVSTVAITQGSVTKTTTYTYDSQGRISSLSVS